MGAFYGSKIRNGETNPNTGSAWGMSDVPKFWKAATKKWLDEN